VTAPDGRTPDAPDVDQPEGGAHGGESEQDASGRTPAAADQAEGEDPEA
jgi:hypothetical protein